jgi:DNA invertase Pin-like site-specific DNA recombinase
MVAVSGHRGRRAVIYARYSSDQQNDRSIEDQVALCRQLAEREGLHAVHVFEDRALSGRQCATPWPAGDAAGRRGRRVRCAHLRSHTRLGRRLADTADIHGKLRFARIDIVTAQHGRMTELHIGVLGTMAQMQLSELRPQTVRGQRGVVREGRVPGGLCYGYEATAGG